MDIIERIRWVHHKDWSKQTIENGTVENLDKEAILFARKNYNEKIKSRISLTK